MSFLSVKCETTDLPHPVPIIQMTCNNLHDVLMILLQRDLKTALLAMYAREEFGYLL